MKQVFEPTLSEVQLCARVCHEVLRAYAFSIGDSSLAHWYNATPEQKLAIIGDVKAHLASGLTMTAEQAHNTWLMKRKAEGWKLGELDPQAKRHPNIMQYNRLPREQQTRDWLFRAAVHAFFHNHFEEPK